MTNKYIPLAALTLFFACGDGPDFPEQPESGRKHGGVASMGGGDGSSDQAFITSPVCANARNSHGIAQGGSIIELDMVIGNSHWVICMNQNYYKAWPFLSYLTNNPDNYPGMGGMVLPNMIRKHKRNNETPLHVLERLTAPVTVELARRLR